VNVAGEGPASNEASATTTTVPSAPVGFVAAPGHNAGEIDLQWQAPASDGGSAVTGYDLYRTTGGATPTLLTTFSAQTFAFTDRGRSPLTQYTYLLAATNAIGEGATASACSMPFPWVGGQPPCPIG